MRKDELKHYGVLGMHWGIRRYQPYSVKPRKSGKGGKEIGALSANRDFDVAVSDVKRSLSNTPEDYIKNEPNIRKVQRRGNLTEKEAFECVSIANDIFKKASKAEPRITKDVIHAVKDVDAKMYGLENRIKQPESIAAKIGSDAKIERVPFNVAGKRLNDILRYTMVSEADEFVSNYDVVKTILEYNGYEEIKCKNYYDLYSKGKVMHKALQSIFKDPKTGLTFELQYHTPESQAAKELKVPIYEEIRQAGVTKDRAKDLEIEMINLAEKVPNPKGINTIKSK